MSESLLVLVTVIYLLVAIDLLFRESYGLATTFVGYAIGNIGMIWAIWK